MNVVKNHEQVDVEDEDNFVSVKSNQINEQSPIISGNDIKNEPNLNHKQSSVISKDRESELSSEQINYSSQKLKKKDESQNEDSSEYY